MAFPTVESVTETSLPSVTTSHDVDLPATVDADDLLLLLVCFRNTTITIPTPSGWTELFQDNDSFAQTVCFLKKAAGSEDGGTVTIDIAPANRSGAAHVYRITGWSETVADIESAVTVSGGTSPNPPSLTPTHGAEDYLWIAGWGTADDDQATSVYPSGYSNGVDTACGAGANTSGRIASARKTENDSSDDPGSGTIASSESWIAFTIAVRPAAAGGGATATSDQTLPTLTQSAAAALNFAGTSSQTLAALVQAGSAVQTQPDITTGVEFDGSTAYLSRGTDLTGNANGKVGYFSALIKPNATGTLQRLFVNRLSRFRVHLLADGDLHIAGNDAVGPSDVLELRSATALNNGTWYRILASWDLLNGNGHLYINDIDDEDSGGTVLTDANIEYEESEWFVGNVSGIWLYSGCMGELVFGQEYIDFSVEANRRDFFDANGDLVSKGTDGSTPTGNQPIVYLSGDTSQFANNFGSGGAFSITGPLTDCSLLIFESTSVQILPAFTQSATGALAFTAQGVQSLAAVEQAGAAAVKISATASQTLAALEQAGTVELIATATGAQTLVELVQSGQATYGDATTGTGDQSLAPLTQTGTATLELTGVGVQSTIALQQAGTATSVEDLTGTGVQTLPSMEQAVVALELFTGSSIQNLPVFIQAGVGDHTEGTVGTGTQELAAFTQTAASSLVISGIALQVLPPLFQDASGELLLTGIAVQTLASFEQSAIAVERIDGSGSQTLPNLTQLSEGEELFAATAAQQLAAFVQSLTGTSLEAIEGNSDQTLAALQQLLVGVTYEDLAGTAEQNLPVLTQAGTALLFTGVQLKNIEFALAQRSMQWSLAHRSVQWALAQRETRFTLDS